MRLSDREILRMAKALRDPEEVIYLYADDAGEPCSSRLVIGGVDESNVVLDLQLSGEAFDKTVSKEELKRYLDRFPGIESDPEAHGFERDG